MAKIDDSVKKKVPELRFKGFTDEWEERKLGEFTTSFSGGTPSAGNSSYYKGDIPFIRSGEINSDKTELFLTEDGLKNSSAKMVSVGDILYALYGATSGEVGISQINGAINQAILAIKPIGGYSSHFIMQWLKLQKQKIIDKYLQGGQGNLSGSIVKDLILKIPNFEEQQKIGSFFKQLDDTIALHQRKLDLLKEQKKGFLQKMFPKNGAKVPELRFAGFADDWEDRKLGDHAKYRRGSFPQPYGNKEWYDGEGAMPFVQVVDVTNKLTLVENTKQKISKLAQSKSVFVPKGKVVVTLQGSIGRVAITQYDSFVDRTLLIFEDYEKETDERFWAYTIQKKFEIEKLKAPGGTIKTITKEALSSFDVHLPKFEEQQKIGSFFKQLDDTIALHQRKCDQTKELKKTMLQKMFPKKGERIPEIRFPEFTDEWEEKKLGEVVEREIKGKAKANMQGTKSIYLETEYLNGGETTFVDSDADIEEDDILILWDGSQAGTVYHGFFGALGSTLKAYRPKESGKFVYYQLVAHQEMIFQRYRTPNIPHVIKTFTDEFSVFTTSLSEQERIGNFFKHLDTLIALHQSKCDSLKELKKTLLRQLFV